MAKIYSEYNVKEPNEERQLMTINPAILKNRFLDLYEKCGNIQATCRILGMVPRTVYHWKKNDKQFEMDFFMSEQIALTLLEDEAMRRAVYGVEKPVFQQGTQVGTVTEYSDTLLIVLLKARAPHKYKDRFSGELTGADGKPLLNDFQINHVHSAVPLATSEEAVQNELNGDLLAKRSKIRGLTDEIEHEDLLGPSDNSKDLLDAI